MMREETKAQVLEHANREYPREACGLLINVEGHERYHPCRNLAENQKDFIMDPGDYAYAEDLGDVLAVVHSHPNSSARPSQADLVACEASGLPWHIVAVPVGVWETIKPSGYKAPLVGRQFVHGVLDCYSLIRDFFREERGIELMDFDRTEEWWNKGQDLYLENFRKAGFEPVPENEIDRFDVILMQIQSKAVNHGAIYLGNDVMLHHLVNRLSCRTIYGGFYKKNTRLVIRYRGAP